MSRPRSSAATRWLLRSPNELLALLSIAFILQAGLVPFDFQWGPIESAARAVEQIAAPPSPLHDIIANLFLFIPFGLFVGACLAGPSQSPFGFFLTLLSAAILSGGLEWIQAYSPSRISSTIDLACNVAGAALGAAISAFARTVVPNLIGAALFEFRQRPTIATLKAYALLLVILGAMPFTFAFDAPRFKQAVRQTVLTPFGNPLGEPVADSAIDTRGSDLAAWTSSRRWSRWAAEAASFMLLAWLFQVVLRGDYAFAPRHAIALTSWLSGLLAVGLSAGQFLVITRGLDVTDILFRFAGVALGLLTWTRVQRAALAASPAWIPTRQAAMCVALWIILSGLAPFRFHTPQEGFIAPWASTAFFPFMAYFETRADLMLTDVLEKVISYALLAAFIAGGWPTLRRRSTGSRLLVTTTIGLILASSIEAVQLFLPVRVVTLTDPLLAAVGCLLGVMLEEHVAAFVSFVTTHRVLGPEQRPIALPALNNTGPIERIMGTLADSRHDAPREPAPIPRDSSAS